MAFSLEQGFGGGAVLGWAGLMGMIAGGVILLKTGGMTLDYDLEGKEKRRVLMRRPGGR
jgi:hypothetical protein